jgi:hypothetical protein
MLLLLAIQSLISVPHITAGPPGSDEPVGVSGVSWKPVVPIKNLIMVGYDGNSYKDDYAYLAAVPASVFYSKSRDFIYSSPLLFYQPHMEYSHEELPMDGAQGVDYFIEDWKLYSGGEFDNVQLINIPEGEISSATEGMNLTDQKIIQENSAYETAREIALYNWEHSDSAVVAVIKENYDAYDEVTENSVTGEIPGSYSIKTEIIQGEKEPSPVDPTFHHFTMDEQSKYISSYMTWYGPSGLDYFNSITQRGRDPDLQLYDWKLGEVAASENWNVLNGVSESIGSYVYNSGNWASAVTYMPTESFDESGYHQPITPSPPPDPGPFDQATYEITNTFYPGTDVELADTTPFFCRQSTFKLTWEDSGVNLGLIVLDPSGAEIATALGEGNPKEIAIEELGEGDYYVAVIKLEDYSSDVQFTVDYSWHQMKERIEGDNLASATEGAVLASITNSPLLFAGTKRLPSATSDALNTLGVEKVYVVDLGKRSKGRVKSDIEDLRSIFQESIDTKEYTKYESIYNAIKDKTDQTDAVFSTINPWTYWYMGENVGAAGEEEGGLYIGPAAYAAAHHGCPVYITDMHPELSTSNAWHNHFWKNAYAGRGAPSVGCMVLTGKSIYNFLKEYDLDEKGMESILTVAGQFDIGTSWDRTLVGAALPGRIMGTPVDTSYWTSRSVLYQAIIFANPALSSEGVELITGSHSRGPNGAAIEIEEQINNFEYPILQSWVSYDHKFNERGSLYWGCDYTTADRITPFRTPSSEPIDQDGKWPDITSSEVVPYYAEKAGYSSAFTTNFETTMSNLNEGVIMWIEVMHGGQRSGEGVVGFWNPMQKEPNPWRAYEQDGSTFEPDTRVMGKNTGLDLVRNPTSSDQLHDGVIICIIQQEPQTEMKLGPDFDAALENIHSAGFFGGSCLIANTYLQLSMVRHGSVFQIIDPWMTSWYCGFAIETFVRDIALGDTVGEAYEKGIKHVGIQYLTESWWWDIFENVVYYGDPDITVYSPKHAWDEPEPLTKGTTIDGHAPFGAKSHPNAVQSTLIWEILIIAVIIIAIAVTIVYFKKMKGKRVVEVEYIHQ